MASFQSNNKDIRRAICQAQPGVGSAESRQVVWRMGRNQMLCFLKIDMSGLRDCQVPLH